MCPRLSRLGLLLFVLLGFSPAFSQPNPNQGPGGPILVLTTGSNPFPTFTAEILRTEGLNEFATADISTLSSSLLSDYDVVVLGSMPLTPTEVTTLTNWVNNGGTLIAYRPSSLLLPLMGLSASVGTLGNKYLLINTSSGPGQGLTGETIQFHDTADLLPLNGAASLATLYSDANTATVYPAVSVMDVGSNGGRAIAFSYDLNKSIVYTRQGNPAWEGQKRDHDIDPTRSDDLFFGNATGDPQPDWIDFDKVDVPQADEQQRLLANIIIQYNLHRMPLPRFWYLPRDLKAAIVMTGDDHAHNGTEGRFDLYNHLSDSIGHNTAQDVTDWYAIRGTSYIYPQTPISDAAIAGYQAQGYEIGLHPTTNCLNFTNTSLNNAINAGLTNFTFNFPSAAAPVTNRTHCMPWSDWATHAKVERSHNMRLDVNYYYWPGSWVQNRPGVFTGSGMPMRFADSDGSLIDVYQAATQITDESGLAIRAFTDSLLDRATDTRGYFGVFTANMHTDTANHIGSNAVIASALNHDVPVISAKQMLNWLDARNNSSFDNISWTSNVLSFSITAGSGSDNLRAMLPMSSGTHLLTQVTLNGNPISFTTSTIKGIAYGFFDASVSGNYTATYAGALPAGLNGISASASGKNVTVTWTTASEENNKGFDVLRSHDGAVWTKIGFVQGIGTSSTATDYSFTDPNLEAGRYYYRLRQVDFDERFKYSVVVSATVGGKTGYLLYQNYPNPATGTTTIQYTIPRATRVRISLLDMHGREVSVPVSGIRDAGTHAISVGTAGLAKGVYYYQLQTEDYREVKKMVVQ